MSKGSRSSTSLATMIRRVGADTHCDLKPYWRPNGSRRSKRLRRLRWLLLRRLPSPRAPISRSPSLVLSAPPLRSCPIAEAWVSGACGLWSHGWRLRAGHLFDPSTGRRNATRVTGTGRQLGWRIGLRPPLLGYASVRRKSTILLRVLWGRNAYRHYLRGSSCYGRCTCRL